jgi:hypothetical protein
MSVVENHRWQFAWQRPATALQLSVLALRPDSGSESRPSFPSAGFSRDEFPDFHGTMEGSDSCQVPGKNSSFAFPANSSQRLLQKASKEDSFQSSSFMGIN